MTSRPARWKLPHNGIFGVLNNSAGTFQSRGNNTITGKGTAPTSGTITPFSPM